MSSSNTFFYRTKFSFSNFIAVRKLESEHAFNPDINIYSIPYYT